MSGQWSDRYEDFAHEAPSVIQQATASAAGVTIRPVVEPRVYPPADYLAMPTSRKKNGQLLPQRRRQLGKRLAKSLDFIFRKFRIIYE
jgi:hypothetical protein